MRQDRICINTTVSDFYMHDPDTENKYLPIHLQTSDNKVQIECFKIALRMAINNYLEPDERDLIRMIYFDEMQGQQVARKLGVSGSTITRRLQRILKKLERQLTFFSDVYTHISKTFEIEDARY